MDVSRPVEQNNPICHCCYRELNNHCSYALVLIIPWCNGVVKSLYYGEVILIDVFVDLSRHILHLLEREVIGE